MKLNIHFWLNHTHLFLEWDIFQKKFVEKIQTKFYVPPPFFFNRAAYGTKYCKTGQATDDSIIRRMRIACWTPKAATHTTNIWCGFDRASSLICGNKMPTRWNRWFLLQILLLAQHVSRHHYAHHQELESILQVVATCLIWCLVFKLSVWCGADGCVSGMRASVASSWHFISTYTLRIC